MNSIKRRIIAAVLLAVMIVASLPVQAVVSGTDAEITAQMMTDENTAFWKKLDDKEEKDDVSMSKADFMKKAYDRVASFDNVSDMKWEDEDTFVFSLSMGMKCVYDYDLRMAERNVDKLQSGIEVHDYTNRAVSHTTSCKNAVVFGPYYGEDSSFTDYYKDLGNQIAQAKGGVCTILSGNQATPAAVKQYMNYQNNNAVVIFDTHGLTVNEYGTSYVSVYGSSGLTSGDISYGHAVALSGYTHYGIDGYAIVACNYSTMVPANYLSDCLVWIAACETMMTNGLGYPLNFCGAYAVYGYSQSVSFIYDYAMAGTFWTNMLNGDTMATALSKAKQKNQPKDPHNTPSAYPVVVSVEDAYPANPDSVQTVLCKFRLINNDPTYTVTFYGMDSEVLSQQVVYKNEDAMEPYAPEVVGYTFTGWDDTFTNITSDKDIHAVYEINKYTVTFKDFSGETLKTETVEHGNSATAPSAPEVENYLFIGWDTDFSSVTSDLTVNAIYKKSLCTVTYLDWNDTVLGTETVAYGHAAVADVETQRTGYSFTGWSGGDITNVTDDMTVKATYAVLTFTVTFKNWDGSVLKTQTVEYGNAATAPSVPERDGYIFAGWDTAFSQVYSDIEVTALFNAVTYTVTFIDWDGRVIKSEEVEYGNAATAPEDPQRGGYIFTGWDEDFTNITHALIVTALYEEYSAPQISLSNTSARPGSQVSLDVNLFNNPGMKVIEFTLGYDATLFTNVSVQNGTTLAGDFTFDSSTGIARWESDTAMTGSGAIMTVSFTVNANMLSEGYEADDYGITITLGECVGADDNPIEEITSVNGIITVTDFMLGDLNHDGNVNTADALYVLRYVAKGIAIDMTAADINGNGSVTTADAMYILKFCAGYDVPYFA